MTPSGWGGLASLWPCGTHFKLHLFYLFIYLSLCAHGPLNGNDFHLLHNLFNYKAAALDVNS